MRRRIRRHTISLRGEQRLHRRDAAALSIRAGDVQRGITTLWITEALQQRDGALETEFEPARRSREQVVQRVAIAREDGRAVHCGSRHASARLTASSTPWRR